MQQLSRQNNQNFQGNQESSAQLVQRIDSDIKAKKLRLVEELANSQQDDSRRRRPKFSQPPIKKKQHLKFAPFCSRTLQIKRKTSFPGDGASFYNKKYNLIMVCPPNDALYFYDATTLLPLGGREVLPLGYNHALTDVSFCSEIDTFLFACSYEDLYVYDFNKKTLKTVQKLPESVLPAVTFINSTFYTFSTYFSNEIFLGNLKDGSLLKLGSGKARTCFLQKLEKKNLLLSALVNGVLKIYRTNCLPRFPAICSVRAHKEGGDHLKIERIIIRRKELMITSGLASGLMKVWHLLKGKMRLLRVIDTGEVTICSCIYLASYKMIATTHDNESIKFFSVFSGKLKYQYTWNQARFKDAFLMKEKNSLGVADWKREVIEIIQLHPQPENNIMACSEEMEI